MWGGRFSSQRTSSSATASLACSPTDAAAAQISIRERHGESPFRTLSSSVGKSSFVSQLCLPARLRPQEKREVKNQTWRQKLLQNTALHEKQGPPGTGGGPETQPCCTPGGRVLSDAFPLTPASCFRDKQPMSFPRLCPGTRFFIFSAVLRQRCCSTFVTPPCSFFGASLLKKKKRKKGWMDGAPERREKIR